MADKKRRHRSRANHASSTALDETSTPNSGSAILGNSLLDTLRELPEANSNAFLVQTREVARQLSDDLSDLYSLLDDRSVDQRIRFNALYLLLFRLRRRQDMRQYRQIVDSYRQEFVDFPLFNTFLAVYERSLGDNLRSMERAIRASRKAMQQLTEFPGVLHQFSELVASSAEVHQNIPADELREAEDSVRKAISLAADSQPHFWATLARLQALQNDFAAARRSIAEAIELEPSSAQDYTLRLTGYQLTETKITFMEERHRAEARNMEARQELLGIRAQLLEVLGLLAAIIAFISTSVNIASGRAFSESSRLLLLSGSIILVVFSSFAYAFRVSSFRRIIVPIVLGLLLAIIVIFLPSLSRG